MAEHEQQTLSPTEETAGRGPSSTPPLPPDALIVVPVRNTVLFPGVVLPITVGRPKSISAAQQAVRDQRPVGILLQRDPETSDPSGLDMHRMGTVANVVRYITGADGAHHLVCQGEQRFQILEFLNGWPFLVARVLRLPEPDTRTPEIEARFVNLKQQAIEAIELLPQAPAELVNAIHNIEAPAALADLAVAYMDVKPSEKQEILETFDLAARMDKVSRMLAHRIEVLRLSREIGQQTKAAFDERQREAVLREQMAAIQKQLGEGEEGKAAEIEELGQAIAKASMPKEVEEQAHKELRRLQRMPESSAEYGMVRTYLDWMIELPWALPEESAIDIAEARRILDEDHYGLDKIKRRIVEYLAVRKLAPQGKAPILCFVGPPGVGKTSLGQSIARAMNRKFVRVSLGGVHDEAEIRGHRRTYIGALPGNIIQGLRRAESRNPVFILDEIDKLGADFRGDPASALLEVLDPEQNNTFRDHYLDVPFDLSEVLFITTANVLDTIPAPLRDRMEVLELPGYTEPEKRRIAKDHLVARQIANHGLTDAEVTFTEDALGAIVHGYTREAGVRQLEREIGAICRKLARRRAEGATAPVTVTPQIVEELLGAPLFLDELMKDRTKDAGVAIGLAWTPVGGDVLFVEASRMAGGSNLTLTGHLGDVMKESARIALSWFRANASRFGVDPQFYRDSEIHLHVPSGAIPKDGPSAGVTMVTALASALTGRPVRGDVAMTGEITLSGRVLPVGGIKEKVLAARRYGINEVILPRQNEKNVREDLNEELKHGLTVHYVDEMDEVLRLALVPAARTATPVTPIHEERSRLSLA